MSAPMNRRARLVAAGATAAAVGVAAVRIARTLPLVAEEPAGASDDEAGAGKKDEKKDMKKKGSGPRTRRKKAKKGK